MPNFVNIDADGQQQGAFTSQQLKELVVPGIITSATPLETDTGHTGFATTFPERVHESIPPETVSQESESLERLQDITKEADTPTFLPSENPECTADIETSSVEETIESEKPSTKLATIENTTPRDDVLSLLKQLAKDFEVKLKYDASKQQLIDKLYAENQQFKEGIIKKFQHTLILAVIEQIDDATKQMAYFANAEFSEDNYRKLLANYHDIVDGFQNMLLEKFDVKVYNCEPNTPFEPKRQRSLKTVSTVEETKHRFVKSSLRPGYEIESGFVLRPELVEVYVFQQ